MNINSLSTFKHFIDNLVTHTKRNGSVVYTYQYEQKKIYQRPTKYRLNEIVQMFHQITSKNIDYDAGGKVIAEIVKQIYCLEDGTYKTQLALTQPNNIRWYDFSSFKRKVDLFEFKRNPRKINFIKLIEINEIFCKITEFLDPKSSEIETLKSICPIGPEIKLSETLMDLENYCKTLAQSLKKEKLDSIYKIKSKLEEVNKLNLEQIRNEIIDLMLSFPQTSFEDIENISFKEEGLCVLFRLRHSHELITMGKCHKYIIENCQIIFTLLKSECDVNGECSTNGECHELEKLSQLLFEKGRINSIIDLYANSKLSEIFFSLKFHKFLNNGQLETAEKHLLELEDEHYQKYPVSLHEIFVLFTKCYAKRGDLINAVKYHKKAFSLAEQYRKDVIEKKRFCDLNVSNTQLKDNMDGFLIHPCPPCIGNSNAYGWHSHEWLGHSCNDSFESIIQLHLANRDFKSVKKIACTIPIFLTIDLVKKNKRNAFHHGHSDILNRVAISLLNKDRYNEAEKITQLFNDSDSGKNYKKDILSKVIMHNGS